ncbi:MAG: DUF167 domain-containing protein [Nanoarchaeota archaeon]|nr:DUF167 domain-containing protein [Nanoarchaeota archaeon]
MIINVRVHPDSKKQGIEKKDENNFIVFLKSPAENNRANAELVNLLHKYFKKEISIKSGLKSRNKIVEVF